MVAYSIVDLLAVGFFILEWTVYAVTLEHTRAKARSAASRSTRVSIDLRESLA